MSRILSLTLALATLTFAASAYADPPPKLTPVAPAPASTQEARKLSDAFVSVAERVGPSVVQIDVTARDEEADETGRLFGVRGDTPIARGLGSGVIYTADGAILTNNHVVEQALTINVRLRDGRSLPAKLIGRDPGTDLAIIKVDATNLIAAKLGDSDAARVGEWVVAIGSPFGLTYSVTAGVLSAKGRGGLGMNEVEDYLQTDASINPGNSGGPLCDLDGHVLGINTMIVGRASGIGFAVPSNMARRVADQLMKTGKVQRPWIGVGIQDLSPDLAIAMKLDTRAGALVSSVRDGGPAAKANMKPGDVIASVAGKAVHDGHELGREVLTHDVGSQIALEIIRNGQRYTTNLTLTARPEAAVPPIPAQQITAPQGGGLGFSVRDLTAQVAEQYGFPPKPCTVVTVVAPGSAADRASLKVGDLIVEADGVADPNAHQIAAAAADGTLVVRVRRHDAFFYAALRK
jgi:Do/DeqQ family serine protease